MCLRYKKLLLLFFFCSLSWIGFSETQCYFIPSSDWKLADPKTLSKRTIIGFIDTKKSGFCPSINLTQEKVSIPLKEYLEVVRKKCLEKKQAWKSLGTIETRSGKAALAAIDAKTKFGEARLLQAILIHKKIAFILTACSLKKDFAHNMGIFKEMIHSMTITEDLFSAIKEEQKRIVLQEAWKKKINNIESQEFARLVLEDFVSLGACWQILMLRKGVSHE